MEHNILECKGVTLNRSGRLLAPWPTYFTSSPATTVGLGRKLVACVICLNNLALYANLSHFSIRVKFSKTI